MGVLTGLRCGDRDVRTCKDDFAVDLADVLSCDTDEFDVRVLDGCGYGVALTEFGEGVCQLNQEVDGDILGLYRVAGEEISG